MFTARAMERIVYWVFAGQQFKQKSNVMQKHEEKREYYRNPWTSDAVRTPFHYSPFLVLLGLFLYPPAATCLESLPPSPPPPPPCSLMSCDEMNLVWMLNASIQTQLIHERTLSRSTNEDSPHRRWGSSSPASSLWPFVQPVECTACC